MTIPFPRNNSLPDRTEPTGGYRPVKCVADSRTLKHATTVVDGIETETKPAVQRQTPVFQSIFLGLPAAQNNMGKRWIKK